ncbi:tetratricopeptide repeat protein [Ghiorsea bivora]|uniref:tetratricopeptide repeat protein n=1 Tax=Ghiorsea bivora TaxID=1485545 RepID=UPI00056F85E2|nr:tetratricopeptide repeat protein [Ghiorsea bivora]
MKNVWMFITVLTLTLSPIWAQAGSNIKRPSLSEKEVSILHLNLIRNHFEASAHKRSFFSSSSELNDTLLQDIDLFLNQYNHLPIAADALFLKGRILLNQDEEEKAAVTWLQVLYEYPQSETAISAKQRLLILIEKDWDDYTKEITAIINHKIKGEKTSRLLSLIKQLYKIDDKNLDNALADLQIQFLSRFPNYPYVDEVQILYAHNIATTSAKSGVFAFEKLLTLYPNSAYRAEALLATADLQQKELKQYDEAVTNYKKLIREYPRHTLVKRAYKNLALIQMKHQKDYAGAVQSLNKIVQLFPKDEMSLWALQTAADLQEGKLKDPFSAVQSLRKLAKMFPNYEKEAVKALKDAAKIARKKLKDNNLYTQILQQVVKDFSKSEAAPRALYDLADFTEKKMNNRKDAQNYYLQLIRQYPTHKLAEKARKRLY